MTYNFQESIEIAELLKSFNPNLIVIFGGYHPSADAENVIKNDNVDFVVIGEGEDTISDLFNAIENGIDYELVPGIVFKKDGHFVKTKQRIRIDNLDRIPFPLRNIELLKECRIYGLMYPPPSKQINPVTIACSRGCPFNCEFCCSNSLWGRGVNYRKAVNIIDEIIEIREKFNTNTFFFTDLTFNSNKKWVKDFCNEILNYGFKFNWYCMCTILGLDEELVRLMSEAGCRKIGFGIETLNDELSNEIKSFKRQPLDEMNEIFDLCFHYNIFTKAYLIIGFPSETYNSLLEYKNEINEMRVDEIKISFYTPFPGTRAFEKYKDKLVYRNFRYFDTLNNVVIKNEHLAEAEYKVIRKEIIQDFYQRQEYLLRMKNNIDKNPSVSESYAEFLEFLSLPSKLKNELTFLLPTND